MSELETGFRIGEVVALVRRQFLVVGAAFVVGAIIGYVLISGAPTTYVATAQVNVGADPTQQATAGAPNPSMETEKDLVKHSDAVANAVRKELKLTGDNHSIRQKISVTTTDKSTVMQISYTASSADEAQRGADAVAEAYLGARVLRITQVRDDQIASLTAARNTAKATLQAKQEAFDQTKAGTPERAQAQADLTAASNALNLAQNNLNSETTIDPKTSGSLTQHASPPGASTSKTALGEGVGAFGLIVLLGVAMAWLLDRRSTLGGGKRRVEQLLPNATMRVMPGAEGRSATAAEQDTAIDRLAVELVAGASGGRARSVLVIGAGDEPPVAIAEELASSLSFAGIPTIFVLAGSTDRELRHAHVVSSFADHLQGASITGPAGLPATAGVASTVSAPTVAWLRPRGSAEASGLLRRAVVEALVSRAGRERYEAVVFVAAAPSRTAAGTALGQWVDRTALVIEKDTRANAEAAATALTEADVAVTEVVWT